MPNVARPARASAAAVAAVAVSAAALAACASSAPAPAPAPTPQVQQTTTRIEAPGGANYEVRTTSDDRSIDATYTTTTDKLWGALPLVYDSLGIKLNMMNAGARSLGAQNARMRRRLGGEAISRSLTCGTGVTGEDNADTYDVFVTVMSAVEPRGGDRATLRTWVQGSARPTGTSGNPVRCASTGWLERRIAQLVALRLGG